MFRVYSKEQISRLMFSVNYSAEDVEQYMNNDLFLDHKDLKKDDYIIVENQSFNNPTYDSSSNTIREMTREEQILILKKYELLQDGEYIEDNKIKKIDYNDELCYLKPLWDKENHVWKESATEEEIKEKYYSLINQYKAEILENGFLFIDKNEKHHQQKCRDKDLSLLGNAIAAGEDAAAFSKSLNTIWSFNDGDILEMTLEELKKLRMLGAIFVQAVFTAEAFFKAQDSNLLFKKEDFILKVNELSDIQCFTSEK